MSMSIRTTALGAVFGLASLSIPQMSAANDAILAHIMDSEHIFHGVSERLMERLDALSDGEMTISYHLGGALSDWTSIIAQVAQGSVLMTTAWNHAQRDPGWDISNLDFSASD